MSKVLAVIGATGQQGTSVIDNVLSDPELSSTYKIRALTRDPNSEASQKLKKNVEVVQADVTDRASLAKGLTGADTVFIITTPAYTMNPVEDEFNGGKLIADVAVETGLKYIIFSTLPGVSEISGGKHTHVSPFDSKAKIEKYIRTLPVKSAFVSLGFFMENFHTQPFLNPRPAADGTFELVRPLPSHIKFPYLAAVKDAGKFVGAILAEPDKFEGKVLYGVQAEYTLEELAAVLSKASGKKVVYRQSSPEEFAQSLPMGGDLFRDAFQFAEKYGYFGPNVEDSIAWSIKSARGRLATFEEFWETRPLQLA